MITKIEEDQSMLIADMITLHKEPWSLQLKWLEAITNSAVGHKINNNRKSAINNEISEWENRNNPH